MRVGKIILFVDDMKKMHDFYCSLLDVEPALEGYSDHWNEIAAGEIFIALHAGRGDTPSRNVKIALSVDNVEEVEAKIAALGVACSSVRSPANGVRVIDFCDPEGNQLSVEDYHPSN